MTRPKNPSVPNLAEVDLADTSKPGLARALGDTHDIFRDLLSALQPDQIFTRPEPERWSADEQARHLITSVNAVAKGLAAPKMLVRWRYGKADQQRSYSDVVAIYRQQLKKGARASGAFVPKPVQQGSAEDQQRLIERWQRANGRLQSGLDTWNEKQLDRLRFPHPVLGPMTVREMLFFTHYHNLLTRRAFTTPTSPKTGPANLHRLRPGLGPLHFRGLKGGQVGPDGCGSSQPGIS